MHWREYTSNPHNNVISREVSERLRVAIGRDLRRRMLSRMISKGAWGRSLLLRSWPTRSLRQRGKMLCDAMQGLQSWDANGRRNFGHKFWPPTTENNK